MPSSPAAISPASPGAAQVGGAGWGGTGQERARQLPGGPLPERGFYARALTRPGAVLAPMAGYSDAPMRQLCGEQGALWTVSEMISARGLLEAAARDDGRMDIPLELARRYPGEENRVIQLFGDDPQLLAAATAHAETRLGAAAVDLNMGCPVPKLRGRGGACLLQTPELAYTLMSAMRAAASGDVSAKIRLGWDHDHALELAQGLEAAGASLLVVHGRTSAQRYAGEADWEAAARVAAGVRVPVLGSGDVRTAAQLRARLRCGVAGVMVGRGAVGNPWLFAAALGGQTVGPSPQEPSVQEPGVQEPGVQERARVARRHAQLAAAWYGERRGLRQLRKVLPAYFPAQPELRGPLVQLETLEQLEWVLASALA